MEGLIIVPIYTVRSTMRRRGSVPTETSEFVRNVQNVCLLFEQRIPHFSQSLPPSQLCNRVDTDFYSQVRIPVLLFLKSCCRKHCVSPCTMRLTAAPSSAQVLCYNPSHATATNHIRSVTTHLKNLESLVISRCSGKLRESGKSW